MEKNKREKRYPEIMPISEVNKDSFASFLEEVFIESPDAMWYERLPTENELESLFSAKLSGCETGSVVDLVYLSGKKLICECEIVKIDGNRAVVGIITRAEGQGTGISDALLQSTEEKAKEIGIKELIAEVKGNNKRAIEFFKRNGYKELEEHVRLVTLVKKL